MISAEERARLVRFGTCVDCPVIGGHLRPDKCQNVERYDHNLEPRPGEMHRIRRGIRSLLAALEAAEKKIAAMDCEYCEGDGCRACMIKDL